MREYIEGKEGRKMYLINNIDYGLEESYCKIHVFAQSACPSPSRLILAFVAHRASLGVVLIGQAIVLGVILTSLLLENLWKYL